MSTKLRRPNGCGILPSMRSTWLIGTAALSLVSFGAVILLAPSGTAMLGPALFLGSSVHVAATLWFYTVDEVRAQVRRQRFRYLYVPACLVLATAAVAAAVPYVWLRWGLLGYFAWQFFHFQKQNLGLAALAGVSAQAGSLSRWERRAIVVAGAGGIAGLLVHPELLQLTVDARVRFLFPLAGAMFAAGVALGVVTLARRTHRPHSFVAIYLISLLFFLPVFCFTNPYAAVSGLIIAHGYQYLLIVGLVAAAPPAGSRGVATMLGIALVGGIALSTASHLHSSPTPAIRALYGGYLGAVMAHFVIDAGLWRLRDEFPRRFLGARLPYLLQAPPQEAIAFDGSTNQA